MSIPKHNGGTFEQDEIRLVECHFLVISFDVLSDSSLCANGFHCHRVSDKGCCGRLFVAWVSVVLKVSISEVANCGLPAEILHMYGAGLWSSDTLGYHDDGSNSITLHFKSTIR